MRMYQVFLLDDEPWILIELKNLIDWTEYGFVVGGEAQDGIRGLERIERLKPDLIVSDIRMPGMDGLELLERLREKGIGAEVIFVSGYSDFEYARRALRFGCTDYLLKPIEEKELTECLIKLKKKLDLEKEEKTEPKEEYRSENSMVKEILAYIQEHLCSQITLQDLSAQFHISDSYASNLIKKKTGKGFLEHLMDLRIQKAQQLLATTNDSIEKIAGSVGYSDYFYFCKVYKKATGISPAEYRRRL